MRTNCKTALFSAQVTFGEPYGQTTARLHRVDGALRLRVSRAAGSRRRQVEPARHRHARAHARSTQPLLRAQTIDPRDLATHVDGHPAESGARRPLDARRV